ncbi:uncharacterized protein LOC119737568 [Patiria miniata]|uniref:Uncharacterized protein n=1 Tax=Patiria miniata TaxID=46514 RepID=A0A914AW14_PATMI|nr:uncharacterized protein LOC119737568 [Patiria miniata]XP_038067948.1 uncharacterized protein LOC119737568 [Patiria miniata]
MSIVIPKSAQRWPVEPEQKGDGKKKDDKKKMKQSKAFNSAKTMNDREQRRLALTLDVFKKDLRTATHLLSLEQKQLRRELQTINPDIKMDPAKGFFVPQGVTQEQAEMLKDNRRASVPAATRSISLAEFDEMRQKRSQKSREAFESSRATQPQGDGEDTEDAMLMRARRRGRRGAVQMPDKPAAFTSMARVTVNPVSGGGSNQASPRHAASSLRKLNKKH